MNSQRYMWIHLLLDKMSASHTRHVQPVHCMSVKGWQINHAKLLSHRSHVFRLNSTTELEAQTSVSISPLPTPPTNAPTAQTPPQMDLSPTKALPHACASPSPPNGPCSCKSLYPPPSLTSNGNISHKSPTPQQVPPNPSQNEPCSCKSLTPHHQSLSPVKASPPPPPGPPTSTPSTPPAGPPHVVHPSHNTVWIMWWSVSATRRNTHQLSVTTDLLRFLLMSRR